jgi:hypothetical protein
MKPNVAMSIVGVILCSALLGVGQSAHASECKPSNVAGTYGHTSSGTIVAPPVGAFAGVGQITLNANGTLAGLQTTSIGGGLANETFEGTFTVNPDCTGTVTVSVFRGTTLVRTTQLNMVWDDHRKEARGIFLTAGTAITIVGRKVSSDND